MAVEGLSQQARAWPSVRTLIVLLAIALAITALSLFVICSMLRWRLGETSALVCEQPVHNFGTVTLRQARDLRHAFVLTNTSQHSVQITKVNSTCGCIAAGLKDTVMAPGSSLEVPIRANWASKAGSTEQRVLLETSSRITPQMVLTVKGDVQVPVALSPGTINFGLLKEGESATRLVKVGSGTATQPVMITQVSSSNPSVSVVRADERGDRHEGVALPGPVGEFAVCVRAPMTGEPLHRSESVTFQTDHPDVPSLTLSVTFQTDPLIEAWPQSLVFTANSRKQYDPRVVKVKTPVLHEVLAAEIEWNGPGPNPFRARGLAANAGDEDNLLFEITFARAEANPSVCRARLVLKGGEHVRELQVLGF